MSYKLSIDFYHTKYEIVFLNLCHYKTNFITKIYEKTSIG